jgi:hypothetical protein
MGSGTPVGTELPAQLPRVQDADFTEQEGVLKVAQVANQSRLVWRPTSQRDVGIDGQIEHVDDFGRATGSLVFVQIKSGPSYFTNEREGAVVFSPSTKHANYWERAAFPVILVLHDEQANRTLWVDARDSLRRSHGIILVPSCNTFDPSGLRLAMGPTPDSPLSLDAIALDMIDHLSRGSGVDFDYFDLFAYGLVYAYSQLYFGMDLVEDLLEAKEANTPYGYGFGFEEYDFLHEYVRYLVRQDLARVSYDDFYRTWDDKELVGRFLAPLTARGEALARFLAQSEPPYEGFIHAIQDKIFTGIMPFEINRRVGAMNALKDTIRKRSG